ncbi:MAG: 3-deoxy-D-manno-octulosonate 8-phosphate phosphatase [Betaproteobacteria bacterium]|nr:3-deoxy-D-manno-octulosonate 8-phosphate phosphatase [Betaproteobacteria bacterium]MBU6513630.1 3-deoxy-D-manno-octulosonate 8-phosphate phosphatase [Betaproteobacteria bacterium]MDE1956506.1 3-deoxy-D-manno-octulosonate 8-phosphate phosphatase [Betaproteobacteria bacterium]MDE2153281.1 3-deoxy-D-manno-octulosonate 8-phosphate phosphatase [Betaproteobacteria bacterium]MDE2478989.1 3-deoxy-D-manno-octulosonate 8-phosphate phosphatase [Betaproteobacteria bacterium]
MAVNESAAFDLAPRAAFDPDILLRAQPVRVLLLDVDGVLTPGDLLVGADGEQLKRFSTLDGHGLKLLASCGVRPAVVSGRDSPALRARLRELGLLEHAVLGRSHKLPGAEGVLRELGVDWEQAAVIGDDWPDLPLLARARLAACPPQSHPEVLARVHYRTRAGGGQGAVRELCDLLLCAQGAYAALLEQAVRGE